MENCLGGRRSKQKQQPPQYQHQQQQQQLHYHHQHQQQQQQQQEQEQDLLQQQQQSYIQNHLYPQHQHQHHPHSHLQAHHHHYQQKHHQLFHQQQQQRAHHQSYQKYNSGVMPDRISGGGAGAGAPASAQQQQHQSQSIMYPHFPPPPSDYPSSQMGLTTNMKQINNTPPAPAGSTMTTAGAGSLQGQPSSGVNHVHHPHQHHHPQSHQSHMSIGAAIASAVDTPANMSATSIESAGVGISPSNRRIIPRYPDDPDAIEVCTTSDKDQQQQSMPIKSFRGKKLASTSASSAVVVVGHDMAVAKWSSPSSSSQSNIGMIETMTTTTTSPGISMVHHAMHHQDYSYAYYEPGAAMRHSNIPPPEQLAGPSRPPPNSIRALLSKGKKNKQLVSPATRQSYQTRYGGTHENFYEEISGENRSQQISANIGASGSGSGSSSVSGSGMRATTSHSAGSLNQSMVEEEFRRVQNRHRKILGELNLSVEAMLMPETPPSGSPTDDDNRPSLASGARTTSRGRHHDAISEANIAELLNTVGPSDDLLSPVTTNTNPAFCGDLDSGFSGSSGASYIGSLRLHKTNAALSSLLTARQTATAGANSRHNSSSQSSTFFGSNSCRSSQRSQDQESGNSVFLTRTSCGHRVLNCAKIKAAEDPGPVVPTESKARSFWNRKGWRKLPGFSSTSSINDAGIDDEPKLNAGSWEDPLPVSTSTTSITTAQLHNSSLRRPDPLCTRSSYNGIPNQLILPPHHHHHSKSCGSPSTLGIGALSSGSGGGGVGGLGGGIVGSGNSGGADITSNGSSGNLVGLKSESGVGCKKRLEHTSSARTINSSEDSWCSERYEQDLSSEGEEPEEDDRSERSVTSNTTHQRNSQLRSTFNKAKQHLSFDKWRTSGGSGVSNNSNSSASNQTQQPQQQQHQQQQHNLQQHSSADNISAKSSTMPTAHHHHTAQDSTTPGESPGGRLSRWFSIRRGSSHQYDVGGRDGRNSSSSSIDTTDASTIENHSSPKTAAVALNSSKMPELPENDDDATHGFDLDLMLPPGSRANGTARPHNRLITPMLPPAPQGLSQQQLKRRHIVAAIVHSENSYVATLQRLVNDYKKPLEESSPPVLSSSKIATLFHRLPDILQSHKVFRIALAECVRNWDRDEKIGDVFVGAFSKSQILEVYSGFINNFSSAMELAKMEEKRKSALADFFKVKQISAHDRLSFFGLMVKPVQRFPQFILFLQDLLKYTPQGHHDRMSLQLALSQLELLAEMLNERKREAEQYQGFKEMLGHISGTFNTRSLTSSDNNRPRYLLREDNVTHMEFNQAGFIVKTKQRRLLLLNDKVICVSVAPKQSHDFGATEKLSFKWMYPVTDVEIVDNSTSATLSRILTAGYMRTRFLSSDGPIPMVRLMMALMPLARRSHHLSISDFCVDAPSQGSLNRGGSLKSNSSSCNNDLPATILTNGADNLCNEMSTLMYDYEVISRIHDLVGSLKGNYKELNSNTTRNLLNTIQCSIQRKDEEMAWVDSCCLQLIARNKSGKEETFTFQTQNPAVKKEWITELRLAQLALDTNNSPAWELPEQHHDQRSSSTKMPLFVKAMPVFKSQHQTEVRCGCYYSIANDTKVGTARRRFKQQNYLWVCTSDGTSSHIAVLCQHHQQAGNLKDVGSFDLVETQVTSMEFVRGLENCKTKEEHNSLLGDLIWMGTDSRRILIYSALNPEQEEQLGCCVVPSVVIKILYHFDSVFVALSNATLLIYRRAFDGVWLLKEPQVVQLGESALSVSSILPINMNIYASCANRVYVLNALTGDTQKSFEVQHGATQQVNLMAHSGIGLWISLKNSSILCLYHTETFKHLQDINIAATVLRSKGTKKDSVNNNSIYVTALMACKGLLWVGTNVGIAVTIPLPRLEGVPIISGGVSMSCHAHFGPITFLLPLVAKPHSNYKPTLPAVIPVEPPQSSMGDDLNLPAIDADKKDSDLDTSGVVLRRDLKEDSLNSSLDQDSPSRGKLDKQNSLDQSFSAKIRTQLANSPALHRKRFRDTLTDVMRMSKTLPRGLGSASFFNSSIHSNTSSINHADHGCCDVYGLYGKLIFVKEDYDAEEGTQGNLMDMMYEGMRRSDPELAAIPGKVSTLDRRLRMKASRPRSLDLSNWSVDSKSSSLYTSSGSEESMGIRLFGGRSVSRNSSSASHKTSGNGSDLGNISENGTITVDVHHSTPKSDDGFKVPLSVNDLVVKNSTTKAGAAPMSTAASATLKRKNKANAKNAAMNVDGPRTIITLMGGRGYWRHVWYNNSSPSAKSTGTSSGTSSTISRVANSNDAHIVVWEKKL